MIFGCARGALVERHFVDVAPAPPFRRIVALDDGVAARVEVLRRVPVRRVVAATDMAAGPAEPQVHPPGTRLQTLPAAARAGRHVADRLQRGALSRHDPLLMISRRRARAPPRPGRRAASRRPAPPPLPRPRLVSPNPTGRRRW